MNQDSAAFIRAIKGPVIMITLGTLFALDSFTSLSFSRTWPVLLVMAGLLNLGRSGRVPAFHGRARYQAKWGPPRPPVPPPPPPPPGPSATSTAPPGSYRGSTYEASPGSPSRGTEPKSSESRETRSTVDDPGATQ